MATKSCSLTTLARHSQKLPTYYISAKYTANVTLGNRLLVKWGEAPILAYAKIKTVRNTILQLPQPYSKIICVTSGKILGRMLDPNAEMVSEEQKLHGAQREENKTIHRRRSPD